jgi:hypothetical protein
MSAPGGVNLRLCITARGPAAHAQAKVSNNTFVYTVGNSRVELIDVRFLDNGHNFGTFNPSVNRYEPNGRYYRLENAGIDLAPFRRRLNRARAANQLAIQLSFRVRYYRFHHLVVKQMAYDVNDGHNFADPADGGANDVLASTTRVATHVNPSDTQWTVTFLASHRSWNNVTVALTQATVHDNTTMALTVQLDLPNSGLGGAVQQRILQALIAADWSRWYDELGQPAATRAVDDNWKGNVREYMCRYVSLQRGAGLIDHARTLAQTAATNAIANGAWDDTRRQREVVLAARNEIDRFLITSNPWGQSTNVGNYPVACHVILAALYSRFDATPVALLRNLRRAGPLNYREKIHMTAQVGMGNCGEHSQVTFRCFEALMTNHLPSRTLMRVAVRSGYANIDHAFVVGGEPPVEVIDAVVRTDHHGAHKRRNDRADVWDAKPAVAAGPGTAGRVGWICDPYLAVNEIAETLGGPNGLRSRTRQWLGWDNEIYPVPVPAIATRQDAHASNNTHVHIKGFCDQDATIAGIVPASGPEAGNTPVTISGSHFEAAIETKIGSQLLPGATVVHSRQITGNTRPHAAGARDVKVKNPGDGTVRRVGGFTYVAPPTVNGVAPTHGPAAGNTPVTVAGAGFVDGCHVYFHTNAYAATNVVVAGDGNSLTCNTPAHAAGAVAVKVVNPDTQENERANAYTYDA